MVIGLLKSFIALTKPTIVVLVVVTGLATMVAEGYFPQHPLLMILCILAIAMAAGAANAFNQLIDRDIDAIMERTRRRRPLPSKKLSPLQVHLFAWSLVFISHFIFIYFFNVLSALISAGTILFYIFVYTLWLKRRHPYNIVIGGVAGSTAPLIASAAAFNQISWIAWLGFLLIFTWTPPHFWALALAVKDDYQKAGIPMLPNVHGDRRTKIEILIYTLLLVPLALAPLIYFGVSDWVVAAVAIVSGWYFIETIFGLRATSRPAYMRLFYVSIFYLFGIFLFLSFVRLEI